MKVANHQMDEILQAVNDSVDVEAELRSVIDVPYLKQYLLTLLSEEWPEFDVEQIEWTQYEYHRSMAGALLLSKASWKMFNGIFMNKSVKKHTQMFQCKSLLEMLCEGEANILIAILTKNLQKFYPNITHEILNKVL